MTRQQEKQMERDLLVCRLSYAVIDIRQGLKDPTKSELQDLEIERDFISRYLDQHKAKMEVVE